jgi:hypothetical protein
VGYRKNRWADQPERLLLISEKSTCAGTLRQVLEALGIGFLSMHGFSSTTSLHDLAVFSRSDERPLCLIYCVDHDSSGRHMSDVDIPGRMNLYGGEYRLVRIALNREQIEANNLYTFPAAVKRKDSRFQWFVRTHGPVCCELDTFDPNLLRDLVEAEIRSHIDEEIWERSGVTEEAELASLADFLEGYPLTR